MSDKFECGHEGHIIEGITSIDITPNGNITNGFVMSDMPAEVTHEAIAAAHGIAPEELVMKPVREGSKRTFGISNWDGCSWEPTGPKGDPNMN